MLLSCFCVLDFVAVTLSRFVAVQLYRSEGNAVLMCNSGRSRSPMYVVAYIVLCYSASVRSAMNVVRELLWESRRQELDRFGKLIRIVEELKG